MGQRSNDAGRGRSLHRDALRADGARGRGGRGRMVLRPPLQRMGLVRRRQAHLVNEPPHNRISPHPPPPPPPGRCFLLKKNKPPPNHPPPPPQHLPPPPP